VLTAQVETQIPKVAKLAKETNRQLYFWTPIRTTYGIDDDIKGIEHNETFFLPFGFPMFC